MAANGICSTANDMSKWLLMNLRNGIGKGNKNRVIAQKTLETLYTLDIDRFTESYDLIRNRFLQPAVTVSFAREGYGMGWEVGSYRGKKYILCFSFLLTFSFLFFFFSFFFFFYSMTREPGSMILMLLFRKGWRILITISRLFPLKWMIKKGFQHKR